MPSPLLNGDGRWEVNPANLDLNKVIQHFYFLRPYTILRKSTFSGDITLGRRLVKATLGEQRIVVRRSEMCLPFGAFREQTIALR
jgi:hypothetical protein